jgi:hypothetical protein
MSKIKITYIETTHVKDVKYRKYLRWWSEHTKKEQRMLDRSVHFFKKNLLFAVFAFHNNKIVAAAGIIKCLDRHGKEMFYGNQNMVVELISNFVEADYRDRDIGTKLAKKRIQFSHHHKYLPVSVTGNMIMKQIFASLASPIEKFPEYDHIRKEVRVCECEHKSSCEICPLKDKAIWVFVKI